MGFVLPNINYTRWHRCLGKWNYLCHPRFNV